MSKFMGCYNLRIVGSNPYDLCAWSIGIGYQYVSFADATLAL